MMRTFYLILVAALAAPTAALAAGDANFPLKKANVDVTDRASLYRGAQTFMASCATCHAAKYMRYGRIGEDLHLDGKQLAKLMPPGGKPGDVIHGSMPHDYAHKVFGVVPPDLSLIARVKGADWLYTYLTSFYKDDSKRWGVNNAVFPGVGMPDVFAAEQGVNEPVYKTHKLPDGSTQQELVSLKQGRPGYMDPKEFDQKMHDLVNFMVYMSEPAKLKRLSLGPWVLGFIALFTLLMFLLKREYWRDIKK